ncbi:MAG: BamA/TamA family outer membrane protein [Nonlabens sp.]|uniref:BamA/TamA family outer membrane protein n=1 Tax=Nonlabens sp. TaxID=1888209 RepID=UPI003EF5953D
MRILIVLIIYLLANSLGQAQSLNLVYKGNINNNSQKIDSIKTNGPFSNFKELKSSKDSLVEQLQKTGYLNILTSPITKVNDSSYQVVINLGRKYKWIELIATPVNREIDSLIEITLSRKRKKNYIEVQNLNTKLEELQSYISNKGYPFLTINTKTILAEQDTINMLLQVKTNEIRYVDNIVVKGYDEFPQKFIESIIKKKYVLNDKNIEKIKEKFKQMAFIEIVKEPEILFKKESTTLYVYAKKKSTNLVDGLIGFNNTDASKLEINGSIDLRLINNLNNGEHLKLLYRGDHKDQTQLDLNVQLPYLFKSKIGTSAGINITRRDSTYQNSTLEGGLFYSFQPQTTGGINYINTSSTVNDNTDSTASFKTTGVSLTLNHTLNSTDQLFINDEYATIEIGSGVRTFNKTRVNQIKIKALLEKNIYFNHKHSFHLEGKLLLLNSKNLLFNELFQVGGINSIRGFNQNSIDTSFFTSINSEYRYRISRGIYLHSIVDYGIFEDFNSSKTENLYGLGVGTAILTQSGILRISIANGTFSRANFDFSSTVAHINLKIKF